MDVPKEIPTSSEEVHVIDENKVMQTIIVGSDWQEVLSTLVAEEGLDPLNIDLVKLADVFMTYLQRMEKFDFRVPARFILVAAILLRMKTELLLEEEEKKQLRQGEQISPINLDKIPTLIPPMIRKPTRNVTLEELVSALNKAFEFKERKETKNIRMRRAIETLIEPKGDIEIKIAEVYSRIVKEHQINFRALVPVWKRVDIVETLMPLLHLSTRNKVTCEQPEMFQDIIITLRESP